MITTQVIGRLVRDPELQHTRNGTPLCRFRLACDRTRGREGASFLDIVVWGAPAETNAEWLRKGRQVAVAGSLEHQQWQNDDGNYRERYELNADHITWLAVPRTDEDGPTTNSNSNSNGNGNGSEPAAEPVTSDSAPAKKATARKATAAKATTRKATAKNGTAAKAAAKAATGEEPF